MNTYIIESDTNIKDLIKESIKEVFESDVNPMIKRILIDMSKDDEFVNINTACKILNVSYPTLRKMIENNELNYEKVGRRYLINKKNLFNHKNNFKIIKIA